MTPPSLGIPQMGGVADWLQAHQRCLLPRFCRIADGRHHRPRRGAWAWLGKFGLLIDQPESQHGDLWLGNLDLGDGVMSNQLHFAPVLLRGNACATNFVDHNQDLRLDPLYL